MVVANTTVTGLVSQEESTIAGRLHQAQGYWEHLYIAGNVNERASPGDMHHDSNQGEQFCWESGAAGLDAQVKIARSASAVDPSDWPTVTIDGLPAATAEKITQMLAGVAAGEGQTWDRRYGLGTGGVSVISGRGAGQVRRLIGMAADNRTLQLDRSFSVAPDAGSVLMVFMTWVLQITI